MIKPHVVILLPYVAPIWSQTAHSQFRAPSDRLFSETVTLRGGRGKRPGCDPKPSAGVLFSFQASNFEETDGPQISRPIKKNKKNDDNQQIVAARITFEETKKIKETGRCRCGAAARIKNLGERTAAS